MTIQLRFDDLTMDDYIANWRMSMPSRLDAMTVPRRHGAIINAGIVEDPRVVEIIGTLIDQTSADSLRSTLDTWAETFARRNKRLTLHSDRYINAYKSGFNIDYIPGGALQALNFSASFLCVDPFWYNNIASNWNYQVSTGDTLVSTGKYKKAYTINNEGKAYVFPKVTVSMGPASVTGVTFRNLTTGRLWTYTATISPGSVLIVDANNFIVTVDGVEALGSWTGDFVYLDKGNNSIEIEAGIGAGTATFVTGWNKRWY